MAKAVSAIMKPVAFEGPLAAFMGKKEGPRFEVPKKIWAYIKSAKLQDPKNGRMINIDAKLAPVLGKKAGTQINMMAMTSAYSKLIAKK